MRVNIADQQLQKRRNRFHSPKAIAVAETIRPLDSLPTRALDSGADPSQALREDKGGNDCIQTGGYRLGRSDKP